MRLFDNMRLTLGFKFQYFFSIQISFVILRVALILQFHETIGPILKIVAKMGQDFLNFFMLYVILTLMFGIVGNINFMLHDKHFEDLFHSVLVVLDSQLGNYDFNTYKEFKSEQIQ